MNLQLIKEIINSSLREEEKKIAILKILAQDKNIFKYLLKFLEDERNFNKRLLLDTNEELSRALVCLNDNNIKVNKKAILNPKWVVSKIKKHYTKYENYILCNFKINDLK